MPPPLEPHDLQELAVRLADRESLAATIRQLETETSYAGNNEDAIRLDYLKRLNERYEAWIANYTGKLLIFNVDDMDFQENPEHAAEIIQKVESTLNGLF